MRVKHFKIFYMFLLVLFAIDFLPSESVCFFYKVSLKHVPLYTLCPTVEVQHAPRSRSNMPHGRGPTCQMVGQIGFHLVYMNFAELAYDNVNFCYT